MAFCDIIRSKEVCNMRLTISKSKNAEQLYITKAFRVNKNKTSSRIIKKLGSMASLLPQFDNDRDKVILWAKEQAKIMTEEEKRSAMKIAVEFSETKKHEKGEQLRFNAGYLFLQDIYHKLGLPQICSEISASTKIEYDLSDILAKLIYTRIISPSSKLSSYECAFDFIQKPNFDLHHIYRSLDVLASHSDEIQSKLYHNSLDVIDRNKGILYYDCTNYFFELEEESGDKKYGKSKEGRPNPIVQMGLFMDGSGLPLAFTMFPGNASEQPSLRPLEKKILRDFGLSKFIVCTDAGLASAANRKFNDQKERSFIVTQSLKKLKGHLQDWALDKTGWHLGNSSKEYDLTEIEEERFQDAVFFKERWINENGLEQRLIVTFSPKYKMYQRSVRERQISRAQKIVDQGKHVLSRNPSSPTRFIDEINITDDGEVAENVSISLSDKKIEKESAFDGFYGVCTTLESDIKDIIHINKQRWQIEAAFRTMKSEFKARPVYLHRDDRIQAHFLTCFIALLVIRILENRLSNKYTCEELLYTLRNMDMHKVKGFGYLCSYTRTDITDLLHKTFGFRTDAEFVSDKTMKKIIKETMKL